MSNSLCLVTHRFTWVPEPATPCWRILPLYFELIDHGDSQIDKQLHLTGPCANCPFRNDDQGIELRPGRKRDIIRSLLREETPTFHCHKTVYRKDGRNHDEEGNYLRAHELTLSGHDLGFADDI